MEHDRTLREHIRNLLQGASAHLSFDDAFGDLPERLRGIKPSGAPHTAWQLLEHLRLAQWDILEFSRDPAHSSPVFPAGYWPANEAPPNEAAWEKSISTFRSELEAMKKLVADPRTDLFAPIKHPDAKPEHTVLREA